MADRPLDPVKFAEIVEAARPRLIAHAMHSAGLSRGEAVQAVDAAICAAWQAQTVDLRKPLGYLFTATRTAAIRVARERAQVDNRFHADP